MARWVVICVFDHLNLPVCSSGGILISPALGYGLCPVHVGWLPAGVVDNSFIRYTQIYKPKTGDVVMAEQPTPKRLAIGLPGGFQVVSLKFELGYLNVQDDNEAESREDIYTPVRISDDGTIEDVAVTDDLIAQLTSVRLAVDELSMQLSSNMASMWDGDERPVSKHAKTLKQV
jgi:hypothetical protein